MYDRNITTQITVTDCGDDFHEKTPVTPGTIFVTPQCPDQYFSPDGGLIPLDSQNQNTQFNFTIPSINSTCQRIPSPFLLSAHGTQSNPFMTNTWQIDCATGRIWLSDRSLTFCRSYDPPAVSSISSFSVFLNLIKLTIGSLVGRRKFS